MIKIKLVISKNTPLSKLNKFLTSEEITKLQEKLQFKKNDLKKGGIAIYQCKNILSAIAYLGDETYDNEDIQNLAAKYFKTCIHHVNLEKDSIELTLLTDIKDSLELRSIEKGILLANSAHQSINLFKKNNNTKNKISIKGIKHKDIITICDAIHKCRILVSSPANILDTNVFIQEVRKIQKDNPWIKTKILRKKELEKEKMNLHLAVARGAKDEPALIVMEYNPPKAKKKEKPIILIGKGLIYDSGGMYMKPDGSMNEMYGDMGGAGVVISTMSVLKKLNINKKIIGICGLAENMVNEKSYKNGDIYPAKNGLMVEIDHTDAEGRLVLADALCYAYEKYNPKLVIDLATLTGACMRALGETYTGMLSDGQLLIDKLLKISHSTNDKVWPLPLDKQIKEAVKSKKADLSNIGNISPLLGASTAAAFLSNFVKDTKNWVHLDIAGSALRSKMKREYDCPNFIGTGAGVHLLLNLLQD